MSLRFSRQTVLCAVVMAGALACGAEPTVRQQAGTVTPDRPARPAAPAVTAAPIETVEIEALEPLFPTINGWERGEVQGEKAIEPVGVTEVHLEYRKGQALVAASIVDSGLNASYLAPFTLFIAQGYKKETATGYERAVKVGDYPAWERWDGDARNGELNVLVGRRFVVQLDGIDIENTKVLHEFMQKFDLGKLGEVK